MALMLVVSVGALAQEKGSMYVGGNFGFSLTNGEISDVDLSSMTLNFRPNFEYSFADNWSGIAYLSVASTYEKLNRPSNGEKQNDNSVLYGFSLGAIRYFPLGDNIQFYVEADLLSEFGPFDREYTFPSDRTKDENIKGNLTNLGANMTFGLCLDFTPKFSIYFELGVMSYKYTFENRTIKPDDQPSKVRYDNFDALSNASVMMIGISYLLPTRAK